MDKEDSGSQVALDPPESEDRTKQEWKPFGSTS